MKVGSNMKVEVATAGIKSQLFDGLLCELHELHLSMLFDAGCIQPYLVGTLPPVSVCYQFDVLNSPIRYKQRHEV